MRDKTAFGLFLWCFEYHNRSLAASHPMANEGVLLAWEPLKIYTISDQKTTDSRSRSSAYMMTCMHVGSTVLKHEALGKTHASQAVLGCFVDDVPRSLLHCSELYGIGLSQETARSHWNSERWRLSTLQVRYERRPLDRSESTSR